ncbi:MAG: GSU2403 family nucleotidyltransferase fold protein [Myxococcota bacterium]
MQRFPLTAQAVYSELLSALLDEERDPWGVGGTLVRLEVKGRGYWYHQTRAGGRVHKRMLGPDSEAMRREAVGIREKLEASRGRAKARRSLVRQLRAAGFPALDPVSGKVLAALQVAGAFRMPTVLVGTQAFRSYPGMLGVRLPEAAAVTSDIDLAQGMAVSLGVPHGARIRPDLEALLRGVDPRFEPVPGFERPPVPTRWSLAGEDLSVELLTPNTGPERSAPVALPALGAHATPLRFLDFLLQDAEPAALLRETGVLVRVPSPGRYALHKLLVAQRRRGADRSKRAKDLAQAEALLSVLIQDQPEETLDQWMELLARGTKWRKLAVASLARLEPAVRTFFEGNAS